jgi:RHS repeat-associated protein
MHQITPHTEAYSTSKTAAYGYGTYTSTTNKSMYVKNSKTGYTYFGARYLDSELSVWLSVDPLASKYPSLSPYAYVANNPIMLKDPDGRDIVPGNDKASGLIRKAIRRVFGSDRIADEIFTYKNGKITTKEKMAGMSFKKFKRKLNRSARKHKGRRGKKKYSKDQLQAAYSIYQKADSEKDIVVTAVTSYTMIQGNEYYKSTNSREKSNYKVSGSEAKKLVNEFIKIEDHSKIILSLPLEMGGGRENRDVEIVNNKTAYLRREIPNGIKVYPSGNMIIDITNTTTKNAVGVMTEVLTK